MSDMSIASVQSLTSTFRKFNRFYTGLIGTLSRGYLKTPFSLQEARVIFEVARNPGCTATEIESRSGFDQAYLSRLVARLTMARLIRKTKSVEDRRAQKLLLTADGKKAFNILNKRANQQARQIFAHLNPEQTSQLGNALGIVQRYLDSNGPAEPTTIREQKVGDLGWVFYRQAVVYKHEFQYNDLFESYVCKGLSPYLDMYEPKKDRLWVGELGGQPVGFVAVHHVDDKPGWAKLRWFLVEKEVRGRGLGSRLLRKAITFCKKSGYKGIFLWTVSDLDAASKLYQKAGFRLTREEKEECAWAPWAREQCWQLRLR